jgi:hypothetical protein
MSGRVRASTQRPLTEVASSLARPEDWCAALLLHLNVKFCRAGGTDAQPRLMVALGKKTFQSLDDVHWLELALDAQQSNPQRFDVRLTAERGPFDTSNYVIALRAATRHDGTGSDLQFEYSMRYGVTARLALSAFLNTAARGKVGFSTESPTASETRYVTGLQGAVERNAMRYFLAISSHLEASRFGPDERAEHAFAHWFDATERYPRQLHEIERSAYLAMKRRELARQQAAGPVTLASR